MFIEQHTFLVIKSEINSYLSFCASAILLWSCCWPKGCWYGCKDYLFCEMAWWMDWSEQNHHQTIPDLKATFFVMSLWRRNRALSKLLLSVLARGPKKFHVFSRQPHDWTDWRKLETKMPQIREQACLICRKQGSIQRCPSYSPPCWEVGQRNLFLFRQTQDWTEWRKTDTKTPQIRV